MNAIEDNIVTPEEELELRRKAKEEPTYETCSTYCGELTITDLLLEVKDLKEQYPHLTNDTISIEQKWDYSGTDASIIITWKMFDSEEDSYNNYKNILWKDKRRKIENYERALKIIAEEKP